jgi:D-3-phosphoglycerate dehydrogenase|tara:strand:+ start:7982 stop:8905 length:924 start_codon:yes stop_codon:yes gene_type:complete
MNILCLTQIGHVKGTYELLNSIGNLSYCPRISKEQVQEEIEDIDILYLNPNKQDYLLDESILGGTNVKIIVTVSRGTNHIDMDYCEKAGIHVIHLNKDPVAAKNSATAEHALGLTLALLKKLPESLASIKDGKWDCGPFTGHQLSSLVVGVVGLGALGSMYAKYCTAIGSTVMSATRQIPHSLKAVLVCCDVISLHVPLTQETYHMIDDKAVSMLKGAFIVNCARGSVVDEHAIVKGLKSGKIKGYATDVLEDEQNISESPIVQAMHEGLNVLITPHVAGTCFESAKVAHFRAIELLKNHIAKSDLT